MNALVIGAARSGIGVARLLNQQGYKVTMAVNNDFRERVSLESIGITVNLDDRDMRLVQEYDLVVKNPGIPYSHPLVSKFDTVYNEIEIASRFSDAYRYYAISGTNGKTTTSLMLDAMLKRKDANSLLAGNVGYALSEAVYEDGNFPRDVALEIAAFQIEGTDTFSPKIYALLNLSPDHLDRFDDNVMAYYRAKLMLIKRSEIFVRNIDDKTLYDMTQGIRRPMIDVSMKRRDSDVYLKDGQVYFKDVHLFNVDTLKLVGDHNILNAMIAACVAYLADCTPSMIQDAIKNFGSVEHRIEFVRNVKGVDIYNDSKSTTPESTVVALKSFKQPIHLLAGGFDKHVSFDIWKEYKDSIKEIYVFGESAPIIMEVFPNAIKVETMEEALKSAQDHVQAGEVILLSPGCASYDQFDNFEQRGNIFKEMIKKL